MFLFQRTLSHVNLPLLGFITTLRSLWWLRVALIRWPRSKALVEEREAASGAFEADGTRGCEARCELRELRIGLPLTQPLRLHRRKLAAKSHARPRERGSPRDRALNNRPQALRLLADLLGRRSRSRSTASRGGHHTTTAACTIRSDGRTRRA